MEHENYKHATCRTPLVIKNTAYERVLDKIFYLSPFGLPSHEASEDEDGFSTTLTPFVNRLLAVH
ncbi:MAG: hypothetical protein UV01_C0002G0077 [Parcubacteria group bacterium GW2011_GWA2_42_14]|nr:MAG: hypothetical protein UV01_C0002G0077 [Parcubacteria group bacterium GW2011_GWA2_42_14]